MARFKVPVTSDTPQETREALDRAGVPTLGPAYAEFVGAAETGTVTSRMLTELDADDEAAARRRVREAVGDGPQVGPVEPLA